MDGTLPDDLLIQPDDEVRLRQHLTLVALGKRPASKAIRVARLLDVNTRRWLPDQEIVLSGRRIAWTGPAGTYRGEVAERIERPYSAVPGFGEVHKHIESTHLTPEYEAALVLPRGCTWTCEASHEFSNVNGERNLDFWLTARLAGSPLKIFPLPGSAVPPTAWEWGGGHYGEAEQQGFMANPMVPGLDEVMDWPAVWNPENPSHDRLWGMIRATFAARGVVEGHAAGLVEVHEINAFAATGIASDHEAGAVEEVLDKLARGLFVQLRPHATPALVAGLLQAGIADWSQLALCTDDRSASNTLKLGATDHNVRQAIGAGLAPEIAIQMVTLNPARHMRLGAWVGSIAPGRFADLVLLDDVESVEIAEVWADGEQVSDGPRYNGPLPRIDWPDWATDTIRIDRPLTAQDFAIPAPREAPTAKAALLRPFHWNDDFITMELPVRDGAVQRDPDRNVTKFAIVDRFSGEGKTAAMFWLGTGPRDPDTALAASLGHDKHNIWVTGSSDAAMADAVNALRDIHGGWALVKRGTLAATVRYEVGGLMTARPAEALDAEMQALYAAAEDIDWLYEPSFTRHWYPGFPERLAFATLTCAPWRWVLVAPSPLAPQGFVNVSTGETHPVVW
ncbi:MAG: adenine deaminase [Rubellimicrobium sp.]|nr:adenine deaminase [Rubellimicrobium sp.]